MDREDINVIHANEAVDDSARSMNHLPDELVFELRNAPPDSGKVANRSVPANHLGNNDRRVVRTSIAMAAEIPTASDWGGVRMAVTIARPKNSPSEPAISAVTPDGRFAAGGASNADRTLDLLTLARAANLKAVDIVY